MKGMAMKKETLTFDECIINVILIENIIYLKTLGMYTDNAAIGMTKYLDNVISQIPGSPIRIWDASDLSSECFQLTTKCVQEIVKWSQKIKSARPGSKAFFIAPTPLIFGVSRMYEIQSSDDTMDVMVLKSFKELPKEIRAKLRLTSL
jgi:hypothetical protein